VRDYLHLFELETSQDVPRDPAQSYALLLYVQAIVRRNRAALKKCVKKRPT